MEIHGCVNFLLVDRHSLALGQNQLEHELPVLLLVHPDWSALVKEEDSDYGGCPCWTIGGCLHRYSWDADF